MEASGQAATHDGRIRKFVQYANTALINEVVDGIQSAPGAENV